MSQEYTIKEVLKQLNISKSTLYYRINKLSSKLYGEIALKNGKTFVSSKGLKILSSNNSLDSSDNSPNCLGKNPLSLDNKKDTKFDIIEVLKKENEFLKNQLIEKDNHIKKLSVLIENSQILLKHEQEKKLFLQAKENKFKIFIKKWIKKYTVS